MLSAMRSFWWRWILCAVVCLLILKGMALIGFGTGVRAVYAVALGAISYFVADLWADNAEKAARRLR
jgi:hypothetical protein